MILQSMLVFLPALLAGFGLAHLIWESRGSGWGIGLKLFIGVGLGMGITSCLYFFRLVLFPGQGGYLLIELGFLGAVLAAVILKGRISLDAPFHLSSGSWMKIFFVLGTLVVLYIATRYTVAMVRNSPHGDYDAQAIWNLRARSIYRLGDAWEEAFSPKINRDFHMDYPLLIPLNVVGGWRNLGGEVLRVPAVQSMMFLYSAAGILFCLLAYSRTSSQAAVALMVLLTTPMLLLMTSFQAADIAVTYYFLAATALLVLFLAEDRPQLLFLAGMMAALSAWTKNEGIPFLLITIMFTTWMLRKRNKLSQFWNLLAGMILPIATIVLFKIHLPAAQGNDLFVENGLMAMLTRVVDPARYISIGARLISETMHLGDLRLSIVIILVIYGSLMGVKESDRGRAMYPVVFFLPLSQLAVYLGIYLVTPQDLAWHMNYSMSRLLLHLYPMILLLVFLSINTPEDVFWFNQNSNMGVK